MRKVHAVLIFIACFSIMFFIAFSTTISLVHAEPTEPVAAKVDHPSPGRWLAGAPDAARSNGVYVIEDKENGNLIYVAWGFNSTALTVIKQK